MSYENWMEGLFSGGRPILRDEPEITPTIDRVALGRRQQEQRVAQERQRAKIATVVAALLCEVLTKINGSPRVLWELDSQLVGYIVPLSDRVRGQLLTLELVEIRAALPSTVQMFGTEYQTPKYAALVLPES